jgi:hypothetical protein
MMSPVLVMLRHLTSKTPPVGKKLCCAWPDHVRQACKPPVTRRDLVDRKFRESIIGTSRGGRPDGRRDMRRRTPALALPIACEDTPS